jgi:hypothetical protein
MSDKIGTSLYYWSFPSDAKRMRELKIEDFRKELETLSAREKELERLIAEESSFRQENVISFVLLCVRRLAYCRTNGTLC